MKLGIKDKVALVTGGCSGIGYAIAESLAEEGANVIVTSRKQEKVDDALNKLKK